MISRSLSWIAQLQSYSPHSEVGTPPREKRGAPSFRTTRASLAFVSASARWNKWSRWFKPWKSHLAVTFEDLHSTMGKILKWMIWGYPQETSTFSHQGHQGSGTVCSVPLLTWPRLLWRTTLSGWNRPVRFSWPGSGVRNGKELTFVKQRTFVGVSMMAWSTRTMSNLDQQTLVDQLSVRHRTIHLTRACQLLWPALVVHCVAWHISTGYVQENVGEALRTQLWQCPQNFWIAPFWYTKHIHLPRTWESSIPTWWFMMVYFRCQSNSIGSGLPKSFGHPQISSLDLAQHTALSKKKEVKGQRDWGNMFSGVDMCGSAPWSWEDGTILPFCKDGNEHIIFKQ